jgi:thioredoxin 1
MKASFENIINSSTLVLIDFYATWCGPCKQQTHILEEVRQKMGDKARIIKIDVDKNPAIANRFMVKGVPTLILFKNGSPIWRNSGVTSHENLIGLITQNQ